MSQQSTNLSAEQIIQPTIQNLENMQTVGDIQNMDNTQNVQTKQAEIPVQTEIAEAFEVKTDVKTDVKVEQNTAEIIQPQNTEKTTKTAQNTGESTQDMMKNETSETEKPELNKPKCKILHYSKMLKVHRLKLVKKLQF